MIDDTTLIGLIEQHAAALALWARPWCDDPENTVQAAFARLAVAHPAPREPVPWLYRVVKHAALDTAKADRRRRNREQRVAGPECWFAPAEHDGFDGADLTAALAALPDELRQVVVLRTWGGLTLAEVAETLRCSTSTAHRRHEDALARLRHHLERPCPRTA